MSSKEFQFVNGRPYYTNSQPSFDDAFKSFNEEAHSTFLWALVASIVYAVVAIAAIVAIVYAIIDCLRKAGSSIPTYARIATSDGLEISKSSASITPKDDPPTTFPVIPDSQVHTLATMERFLRNMENEKPIRFSPQQLARFTQDYSTLLGSGGFGVVYKGEFPDGVKVAVKVINSNSNKRVEEQFMAEVSTIGRTYHINLVRLYGFCFDPAITALVYEFMENGSLDSFLFDENNGRIEWGKLYEIALGTAKGIAYLHEECHHRIIHYDIKPGNVLLDTNLSPKVADFGLAKLCNRDSSHVVMTGCRGTPGYAAPELWKPYPVTHKCDVYSFGMLLFEIVGRRKNHETNLSETQEWLPRWTWEMFDKDKLLEMLMLFDIEETDIEKAERMCIVALWCVQYSAEARPLMSLVVKMLEGGLEIMTPPNPFEYLESFAPKLPAPSGSSGDWSSSTSTRTNSENFHSIPMEKALEIEMVS